MANINKTNSSIAGEDAGKGDTHALLEAGGVLRESTDPAVPLLCIFQKDYVLLQRYLLIHVGYCSNLFILSLDTHIHTFSYDFDKPLRISSLKQVSFLTYPVHADCSDRAEMSFCV